MKIKVYPPEVNRDNVFIKLETDNNDCATVKIAFCELRKYIQKKNVNSLDFFILSSVIYGVDRFLERKTTSIDGWSREIHLEIPIHRNSKLKVAKSIIEKLLSFLTGDYWEVDFYIKQFNYSYEEVSLFYKENYSQVNLLSGGLDSLIGAIDCLETNREGKIIFVSHYDPEMKGVKTDQSDLIEKLKEKYQGKFIHIPSVSVTLKNDSNKKSETTFRSRSLLFIGLAQVIAENFGVNIVIPENGTVSLNYPLSPSRRSSCSTRTTHPRVLELINSLFEKIAIKTRVSNPYEFCTKGEMVSKCKNEEVLLYMLEYSNSCGKRGHCHHWDNRIASHCGICMPCLYRKAALLKHGDKTQYGNNINTLYPFDKIKGQDMGACLEYLKLEIAKTEIIKELIVNGVTNLDKIDEYAEVVLRAKEELKNLIRSSGSYQVKKKAGL